MLYRKPYRIAFSGARLPRQLATQSDQVPYLQEVAEGVWQQVAQGGGGAEVEDVGRIPVVFALAGDEAQVVGHGHGADHQRQEAAVYRRALDGGLHL